MSQHEFGDSHLQNAEFLTIFQNLNQLWHSANSLKSDSNRLILSILCSFEIVANDIPFTNVVVGVVVSTTVICPIATQYREDTGATRERQPWGWVGDWRADARVVTVTEETWKSLFIGELPKGELTPKMRLVLQDEPSSLKWKILPKSKIRQNITK